MPIVIEEADGLCSLAAGELRLEFRREGDRWGHRVVVRGAGGDQVLAEALNPQGDETTGGLASPIYQEVSIARGPDGPTLLAVGRHGAHHYAATFALREAGGTGPGGVVLEVDVADRCRAGGDGGPLAATYRVDAPPVCLTWGGPTGACWGPEADGRFFMIEGCRDGPGARVVVSEAGRGACVAQVLGEVGPHEETRRLRYVLRHGPSNQSNP